MQCCYNPASPYEINPISQLSVLPTAQLVPISNSHSHLLYQENKQLVHSLCTMKEQHPFLPLQNRSLLFTNTILQCIHCIIRIRDALFNLCYHFTRHVAFYNRFPYKSENSNSMKITAVN